MTTDATDVATKLAAELTRAWNAADGGLRAGLH